MKLHGTYSFLICGYDQNTGRITSAGRTGVCEVRSPFTIYARTPKKIADGTTHWIVYGTPRGKGPTGPYHKVPTVMEPVGSTDIKIDYYDGELGEVFENGNQVPMLEE